MSTRPPEVAAGLAAVDTRRAGATYLDRLQLSKVELLAVARHLDIAAEQRDTVEIIRRKLVDGTVGAREDAAAFRSRSWR